MTTKLPIIPSLSELKFNLEKYYENNKDREKLTNSAHVELPPAVRNGLQAQQSHPREASGRQQQQDQQGQLDVFLDLVGEEGGGERYDAARRHREDADSAAFLVVDAQAVVEVDGHDGGPGSHDTSREGVGGGGGPDIAIANKSTEAVSRKKDLNCCNKWGESH